MDLLEGLATTRAIRRYRDDPVPEADLNTILWHATRAPSGSNRQPFRFLVLRHGPVAVEARALLAQSFSSIWAMKEEHDGYREGSGADPNSPKARMAATMRHFVDHVSDVPVVVDQFVDGPPPYRTVATDGTAQRDRGPDVDTFGDVEHPPEVVLHRSVPAGQHPAVAEGPGRQQQVLARREQRRTVDHVGGAPVAAVARQDDDRNVGDVIDEVAHRGRHPRFR